MSQINNDGSFKGDEFDVFMGAAPAAAAGRPAQEAPPAVDAAHGAPVDSPKRSKRGAQAAATGPAAKKKKLMLLGTVGAVVLVAGVGLVGMKRGGANAPGGDPSLSPEIAEVIAAAEKMGSNPPTPSPDYAIPTDDAVLAVPGLELDGVVQPEAVPASAPVAAATEVSPPVVQPAAAVAAVAPAAAPAPVAVVPAPAPAPAADTGEFTRRIQALEGDLARARSGLKERDGRIARLEREARKGDYTLVAVLNDGAVVRDSSGREQVITVGRKVGQ